MEYTKGEWEAKPIGKLAVMAISTDKHMSFIECFGEDRVANAQLISAAPLGDELAEFVIKTSATWISEGLLEMGEGDYLRMKELALKFKAKAEGK